MISFLHIPKTGGTYIAQLESGAPPVLSPMQYLGHACLAENPTPVMLSVTSETGRVYRLADIKTPIVATIRNPFSWLVSAWDHFTGRTPEYPGSGKTQPSFRRWVREVIDGKWTRPHSDWPGPGKLYAPLWTLDTGWFAFSTRHTGS